MCSQNEETVGRIVSEREALAKTQYISRHNKAAAYISPLEDLQRS